MISPAAPTTERRSTPPRDRWRRSWLIALVATFVLVTTVLIGREIRSEQAPAGNPAAAASPAGSPDVMRVGTPASSPEATSGPAAPMAPDDGSGPDGPAGPADESGAPSAGPVFPADGVLQIAGSVPDKGSGRFEFAATRGAVAGTKGKVRRYKVAVEKGSGEDLGAFTAQVRAVLEDSRSWIGAGRFRLQMVTGAEKADFTVYLATRGTAGRMCQQGGTNIRIGGVPYTSCRTTGKAIINLDRWRKSARPYVESRTSLAEYRRYVINHEVGHEFGHRHESCPKAGGPAPVMVQQTLTLRGCVPYSWPRRNGRDLSGPSR